MQKRSRGWEKVKEIVLSVLVLLDKLVVCIAQSIFADGFRFLWVVASVVATTMD